jgi:hypothetical protein
MAWDERITCSFKLALPPEGSQEPQAGSAPADSDSRLKTAIDRVGSLMPRFRPAGVTAFIDQGRDSWILGESLLRSAESGAPQGNQIHATRLHGKRLDQVVI